MAVETVKPKYYQEAERLLGTNEIPGKQTNEEIKTLFEEAGHPEVIDDETPWCAAFVGGTLTRGNKKNTGSLLALSYADKRFSDRFTFLKKPEKYCIAVMKRGSSGWEGHVGYVADFDANTITLLGGNQSNGVKYAKFPRSKFVSFSKPRADSTDVTKKQLNKDSRQLKVTGWYEKLVAAVSAATITAMNFYNGVKDFVQDNIGLCLVAAIALGIVGMRIHKYYLENAYKDGRYLPKAHE